ncbi:MAG: AI-2E family transporter, partial [Cyclobacteriaceae bacterium]
MQANKIFTSKGILLNFTLLVTGLFFFFYGLIEAKEFLAPLVLAAILALLTFPLANKLEAIGLKQVLATIINVLILLLLAMLFFLVISWQMKNIMDDWDDIKKTIIPKIEEAENYILTHTPIEEGELEDYKSNMNVGDDDEDSEEEEEAEADDENGGSSIGSQAGSVIGGVAGFLTDFLITYVYIFFFIHFRKKFKYFILKLFKSENREEVNVIIS